MSEQLVTRDKIKLFFFIILIILTISYGIWRAVPLMLGTSITIYSPKDFDIVASSSFKISGKVVRATELKIQGKTISTDTDGNFNETLVASEPSTLIVIEAKGKYNEDIIKTITVVPAK